MQTICREREFLINTSIEKMSSKLIHECPCALNVVVRLMTGSGQFLNCIYPPSFHGCTISQPSTLSISDDDDDEYYVVQSVGEIVLFVCLEAPLSHKGRFHPNGFTCFPGHPVKVHFRRFNTSKTSSRRLEASEIKVKTLYNLLQS